MSRDMFGPDVSSSLTVDQLTELVEGVRFVHRMRQNPVEKDVMAAGKRDLRRLFGKSAVAVRELRAGDVVKEKDVAFRKPGHGLSELQFDPYVGRKVTRLVPPSKFFEEEDFE